jgi:hypothetical protein
MNFFQKLWLNIEAWFAKMFNHTKNAAKQDLEDLKIEQDKYFKKYNIDHNKDEDDDF